jgi:hypothetical protein
MYVYVDYFPGVAIMDLILLKSDEGQVMLQEAEAAGAAQPKLSEIFSKQTGSCSCGIQSMALLLSAVKNPDGSPVTDKDVLASDEVQRFLSAETKYQVDEAGLALQELFDLVSGSGHEAQLHYASDLSVSSLRSILSSALKDNSSKTGVIINYHMQTLGQSPPYGHHSPVGAYHEKTDRVLVYDCWPETHECWTTVENLHKAMMVVDSDSNKTRGLIVISKFKI